MYKWKKNDGLHRLCVFKGGNNRQRAISRTKRDIANTSFLVASKSGSGKSSFINFIANVYKECGYTVIYVTEKPESELENAMWCFGPTMRYQIDFLKNKMGVEPKTYPIKVYHPITYDIPFNMKLPPMEFFSYNIRDISERGWSVLLAGHEDHKGVQVCADICKDLDKDECRLGMIHEVNDMIRKGKEQGKKDKYIISKENDFLPVSTMATEKEKRVIQHGLKPFRHHCMLGSATCKYNLNFIDMLNDSKHIHLLTHKYFNKKADKRLIYFSYIQFLEEIEKAMGSGKVRKPILIILEEIKILLPKTAKTTYESQLADVISDQLSGMRSLGAGGGASILATTQNLAMTNKQFVRSCVHKILGRLDEDDITAICRDQDLETARRRLLQAIKKYEWTLLDEIIGYDEPDCYYSLMPFFKIAEEKDDFFNLYKKHFPHLMRDNKILKKELDYFQKEEDERFKKKVEQLLNKETKVKEQEEEQKKRKELEKDNKKEGKVQKVEKKLEDSKQHDKYIAYSTRKENKGWGWGKVITKCNTKDKKTAQKWALLYAHEQGDWDFIREHFTQAYLRKKHPKIFTELTGHIATPDDKEGMDENSDEIKEFMSVD